MKKNKLIAMLLFTFVFISSFQMVYSEELEELSSQQSKIEQMKTLVSSFFVSAEDLEQREAIESALNEILNRIDAIEERVQSRIEEVERANAVEAVEGWEKFKHPYYGFEINFPSDIWCGEVDDYKWSPGSIGISDTYLAFSSLDDEVCVRGICPGCPIIVESPILLFVCEEGSWKEPDKDCVTEEGFSAHYYANFSEPKLEDSTKRALLELNEEQTYRIEMILFDDDYEEIFDNIVFSYSEKGTTNGFYKNEEYGFQLDYQEPLEINDSDSFLFDASVLVGDSTRLTKKNFIITKTEGGYDHPIEDYCEQGAPNTFMTSFNDIDFCQHTMYEEVNGDIVFNYLAYHIIIDREWITFNFNYTSCNPSYSEECRDLSYVSDEKLEEEARKIISTFKFLD
jgi:hypothetical protein